MLTFLIVALVMGIIFFFDLRQVVKSGETAAIVFYGALTVISLIILALHSFGISLPSIYGF